MPYITETEYSNIMQKFEKYETQEASLRAERDEAVRLLKRAKEFVNYHVDAEADEEAERARIEEFLAGLNS